MNYCDTIEPEDFLDPVHGFGRGGSIRNLLVHIGNTYEGWLAKTALERETSLMPYERISTVAECRTYFLHIDTLMDDFLNYFQGDYKRLLLVKVSNGNIIDTNPLQLFTHVITHEFHHKGQILSISRHLGYTPVDTDVLR